MVSISDKIPQNGSQEISDENQPSLWAQSSINTWQHWTFLISIKYVFQNYFKIFHLFFILYRNVNLDVSTSHPSLILTWSIIWRRKPIRKSMEPNRLMSISHYVRDAVSRFHNYTKIFLTVTSVFYVLFCIMISSWKARKQTGVWFWFVVSGPIKIWPSFH